MNLSNNSLYIVSTPIGNLDDITVRAIEVLKTSDIILCEDTRHSLKLLNHYKIKKTLISYHKFNEKKELEKIIKYINEGKILSLISDAGTPLISDPGRLLVKSPREPGRHKMFLRLMIERSGNLKFRSLLAPTTRILLWASCRRGRRSPLGMIRTRLASMACPKLNCQLPE